MRREQPAEQPDRGVEHRDFAVDIEIEAGLDPVDTRLKAIVEPHQPQGVERFDQAEAEVVLPERKAGDGAADE